MDSDKIRKLFLEFFKDKGHVVVPSSSLVPENDPTTLFTGSGMQPMMPYLLGEKHPLGKRIADSQKCFRAEDIEKVGDNRHTTFFEMLGNWSFGDYWKKEQLSWVFEFLTEKVGLDPKKLYVTVFSGGEGFDPDDDSIEIWQNLFRLKNVNANYVAFGTEEEAAKKGLKKDERIVGYGVTKNWWSRSGPPANMPVGEPGGPDSEIFYEFTQVEHDKKFGENCHPNCDCGRFLEIGNSVFMEFKKLNDGSFESLPQRNVDFGGGLERIATASKNDPNIYNIDFFQGIISGILSSAGIIHEPSNVPIPESNYPLGPTGNNVSREDSIRFVRIIVDHMRAAVFLVADGVIPSNVGRGYFLRRVIRRIVRYADKLGFSLSSLNLATQFIAKEYGEQYPETTNKNILGVISREEEKFRETLSRGLKELHKVAVPLLEKYDPGDSMSTIDGKKLFWVFSTYGFPFENSIEEIQNIRKEMNFPILTKNRIKKLEKDFLREFKIHQELSRTASAGMFKGGLADHSERTTRLHTAHHLLLKALQVVLGLHIKQRGSNITSERLRMDFLWDKKMTDEQKHKVEKMVNEKIAENLPIIRTEMPLEEAEKLGAEHEFGQKYPERVSVYSIGPKDATPEDPKFKESFSIEFCGGPHVSHTGEIGKFKITKEQASSAGIRRIRAIIE